ncbi:MAG: diaminopimelate epimerase [Phycisphaerae bacterium]|jgi:diaminopimelate epimerase
MRETIDFVKLSGSGNDFLCLDSRGGEFDDLLAQPAALSRFARTLCQHGMGVGADGLIFATACEAEGMADAGARFLEPDGAESDLCGNGTACFVRWGLDSGWVANGELRILTAAGVVRGKRMGDHYVRVCIPLPEEMREDFELSTGSQRWTCDYCLTGVPHLITYVPDVSAVDVARWGPLLRHHPEFGGKSICANFVQVLKEGEIALRTFEYGVEGETLACGTGSAAAAIMVARRCGWPSEYLTGDKPVQVHARSGDILRVYFAFEGPRVTDLCLETVVRFLFRGTLHADLVARALGAAEDA